VMRDGRVAQASSPVDLYRAPVDTAVARFVGGANVMPGRAQAAAEHQDAELVDTCLGVLPLAVGSPPGDVQVVVRPEQVRLEPLGDVETGEPGRAPTGRTATVDDVTYYGHDATVWLRLVDGTSLVSRVVGQDVPVVGDRVLVSVAGAVRAYPVASGSLT
jgi:iron(III) transport system ATP-binding protein